MQFSRDLPTWQSGRSTHTALPTPTLASNGFSNHVNNGINNPLKALAQALLVLFQAKVEEDAFLLARHVLAAYMVTQACGPIKQAGKAAAELLNSLNHCKDAAGKTLVCDFDSLSCGQTFQLLTTAHEKSMVDFNAVKALVMDFKQSLEEKTKQCSDGTTAAKAVLKAAQQAEKHAMLVANFGYALGTGALTAAGIMAAIFWPLAIPPAVIAGLSGLVGVGGSCVAHKLDARVVMARDELTDAQAKKAAATAALDTFLDVVPKVLTGISSLHSYVTQLLKTIQADLETCHQYAQAGICTKQYVYSLCKCLDEAMKPLKELVDVCKRWEMLSGELATWSAANWKVTHGTNVAQQANRPTHNSSHPQQADDFSSYLTNIGLNKPKPASPKPTKNIYPTLPVNSISSERGARSTGQNICEACRCLNCMAAGHVQYHAHNTRAHPAHAAYGIHAASPHPGPGYPPPPSPAPAPAAAGTLYPCMTGLPSVLPQMDSVFGQSPYGLPARPVNVSPSHYHFGPPPAFGP